MFLPQKITKAMLLLIRFELRIKETVFTALTGTCAVCTKRFICNGKKNCYKNKPRRPTYGLII